MNLTKHTIAGQEVVIAHSPQVAITDAASALDLIMTLRYENDCDRIALNKEALPEEFFILSTGFAGEVLQKVVNYHFKFAIYGDFSGYTSKPLRDFIRESNNGRDIFFTATPEEAAEKLANAR